MSANLSHAAADAARYARENPGYAAKAAAALAAAGGTWESRATPEQLAWAEYLKTESREDFWTRHAAMAERHGLVPRPPLKGAKRGPSKLVLQLQARIRELEAQLAASAPQTPAEWLEGTRAKLRLVASSTP